MAHVRALAQPFADARLHLPVRGQDAGAQRGAQHPHRVHVGAAGAGLALLVRHLIGLDLEGDHADVLGALVIEVLHAHAHVAVRVMVVQISDRLEARGERPERDTLRHLHVGALDQAEDATHPLRVGRVHVGIQLAHVGVQVGPRAGSVRLAAARAIDVLEDAIRIGPEAHSTSVGPCGMARRRRA